MTLAATLQPHLLKAKKANKKFGFLFDLRVFVTDKGMVFTLFC